jgi:hypothetical protein
MTTLSLKIAACSLLLLPSCASKFTAAQRDALSTVTIATTIVQDTAYAEPNGGDRQAANQAGMAGVYSQTGALGGLLGASIGENIFQIQNNMFRTKNQKAFSATQTNTPPMGPLLNTKLTSSTKNVPFFASKVRANSPNFITSSITSYGLVRGGKAANGEILLVPQIAVKFDLIGTSGKSLAGGTFVGTGFPNPISVYACSAAKSREGYESAAKIAVGQFTTVLEQKTSN